MLARNAWTIVVATALAAAAAGAQQPTKPTSTPARSATAQQPTAAKSNAKTSTAAALPVNTDSAKKIVMTNVPGATITSTHLRRTSELLGLEHLPQNQKRVKLAGTALEEGLVTPRDLLGEL